MTSSAEALNELIQLRKRLPTFGNWKTAWRLERAAIIAHEQAVERELTARIGRALG